MKRVLILSLPVIIAVVGAQIWTKRHPDATTFLQRHATGFDSVGLRMGACVVPQLLGWNPEASTAKNSLEGQRILITGGTRGIGFEISKGLVERGAQEVLLVARNDKTGNAAVESIQQETSSTNPSSKVRFLRGDLSDLESVTHLVDHIKESSSSMQLDQLILNAGLWPAKYAKSRQGHEIAYATNLLGPHLLLRKLLHENVLKPGGRVIVTVGELYVSLKGTENLGCSSDFYYEGDGEVAYCRSKLGIMTLFYQYLQRFPNLHLTMVHPGVVGTELVNAGEGNPLPKPLLITNNEGAQTTLILATEATERGGYYHNCLGKLHLPEGDPAKNSTLGSEMWALAETLSQEYL